MRQVGVVGSRTFRDRRFMHAVLTGLWEEQEFLLVSGACPDGADFLAERWAETAGVPCLTYPADWVRPDGSKDRGAGHARNSLIARDVDLLIAFWDGESRGTLDTIWKCLDLGKPVQVYQFERGKPGGCLRAAHTCPRPRQEPVRQDRLPRTPAPAAKPRVAVRPRPEANRVPEVQTLLAFCE